MAHAQNAGSLRGNVADNTGAVVPGATVTLTSEATKFTREASTDAATGRSSSRPSSPAATRSRWSMQGFKTHEHSGVRVSANDTVGVDVILEVGAQAETVESRPRAR